MQMCFEELRHVLISKLGDMLNMEKLEILVCIGTKEYLKKDLSVTNDTDIKWVYHILSTNVEQDLLS